MNNVETEEAYDGEGTHPLIQIYEDRTGADLGDDAFLTQFTITEEDRNIGSVLRPVGRLEIDMTIETPIAEITYETSMGKAEYEKYFQPPAPAKPRRFELVRTEDVSGTSGTGVVARGVAYPDGAVHMQWLNADNDDLETDSNGCAFKPAPDGIEATEEIHGHEGRTEIQWIDEVDDE